MVVFSSSNLIFIEVGVYFQGIRNENILKIIIFRSNTNNDAKFLEQKNL